MSDSHPSHSSVDMPVATGDVLAGKYEVENVLGVGGMGVVVRARHIQLEQKVALKFLLPQAMQSPEAVERFLREARAAVRLRSEHVAKVSDVGTLDNGSPYMVMEYLEGADLSRVIHATDKLDIEEAVDFVLQACEAIAEAHSLGIIHRDLKPQNLFVTRRVDGRPLIKVLDFGISKSIDGQAGLSLTRTSSIMGSPLYMSPEQMRSSKNVDQRSDIWGLGVILYELLTQHVPFEAEAIPELCLKVVQDPAPPPRGIRPDVPEGLNAVVLKCLEKDPANRFDNVADLAASLESYSIRSRGSSERIAATLNIPSRPPMVSISSIPLSASNPKVGTGGTAWGSTQAIATKRRIPIIAGGAGVVALLGAGLFLGFRDNHQSVVTKNEPTLARSGLPTTPVSAAPPVSVAASLTAAPTAFDAPPPKLTTLTTAKTGAKPNGTTKPLPTSAPSSPATKTTAAAAVTAAPKNFE